MVRKALPVLDAGRGAASHGRCATSTNTFPASRRRSSPTPRSCSTPDDARETDTLASAPGAARRQAVLLLRPRADADRHAPRVVVRAPPADRRAERRRPDTGVRVERGRRLLHRGDRRGDRRTVRRHRTISYRELMALTQRAEFLVSGRYHNPILSAIVGCPTIALRRRATRCTAPARCSTASSVRRSTARISGPASTRSSHRARGYTATAPRGTHAAAEIADRRRVDVLGLGELVHSVLRQHA